MQEETFATRGTTAIASAIVAVCLLLTSWGFGIFGHHISAESRIAMVAGGTLVAFFAWRDALIRIRLGDSSLIAEYVFRRRVVPYDDIEDIGIQNEVPLRMVWAPVKEVIVLRRKRGSALVLRNFDDEIAAPFGAIQRRWSSWMDKTRPGWRSSLH